LAAAFAFALKSRHCGTAQRNPEANAPALAVRIWIGNVTTLVSGFRCAAPE
jgi:hypothetical protein